MKVDLDDIPVTLFRKNIKNINLRIQPSGEVHVSAPARLSLDKVYRFLYDKKAWIHEHRSRLQAKLPDVLQTLQTGDRLFFWGHDYDVVIHNTVKKNELVFENQQFQFFIKTNSTLKQKQALLTAWYHEQLQQRLPLLFKKWEEIIGVTVLSYRIRTMKTRWGSCHPIKKDICINLRLIQKPLVCLEYIVVHELVHLLEASHNKRFHALVTKFMPDWKAAKRLLD